MTPLDKRARKILFGTFWKNGWIDSNARSITPDDFAYAKSKGLMFDPFSISHDELVSQIVSLIKRMPEDKAAMAFLSSLTTSRVDWRSALASWHFGKTLESHVYADKSKVVGHSYNNGVATPHVHHSCAICGADESYVDEDLNVLNFERIRWGGVRHGQWIYTLLDLQKLFEDDIPGPTPEDIAIFESVLSTIASSAPADHPGTLRDRLKDVLPSTKEQRSTLLEILAAADILPSPDIERPGTGGRNDWTFVANWRGEDGFDQQLVHDYFHRWSGNSPFFQGSNK